MASSRDFVGEYNSLATTYFDTGFIDDYYGPRLDKPRDSTLYFDEDSYTLQVIQNLIKAFEDYRLRVYDFEKNNGKTLLEFHGKYKKDNSKPFYSGTPVAVIGKEKTLKKIESEWQKRVKNNKYNECKSAIAFLKQIVWLLERVKSNEAGCIVSDAIDVLAKTSTGNTQMDNDNKKLLDLYRKKIDEDVKRITGFNLKKVNGEIDVIKKTNKFYQWKSKSSPLLPDQKDLGLHGNCGYTFKTVFDCLRKEAQGVKFEVAEYKPVEDNSKKTYRDRISKITREVELMLARKAELKDYHKHTNGLFEEKDIETLKNTAVEATHKIDSIIKLYKALMKSNNKKNAIMIKYVALQKRLDAINEALEVASKSKLFKTHEMLLKEKNACVHEINRYKDAVNSIEGIISKVETEIIEYNNLMNTYDSLVAKNDNEILAVQDRIAKENSEYMARANGRKTIKQQEIDKVKLEVLRTMKLDGYAPDISYPNDYEHPKEVYNDSFNEEFYRRLKEELNNRGIDYEGADLSNPYDTSIREKAHELSGGKGK